jgi:hypothetical protein
MDFLQHLHERHVVRRDLQLQERKDEGATNEAPVGRVTPVPGHVWKRTARLAPPRSSPSRPRRRTFFGAVVRVAMKGTTTCLG